MTKTRVFDIIQVGNATDIPSRIFDMAFILMVLNNLFIALFCNIYTYRCPSDLFWLLAQPDLF